MKFINLRMFRQERNISQKQLVIDTGLPQSTVSYIENGYQEISDNHLELLQKAYPETDFGPFIYESEKYPYAVVKTNRDEEANRTFSGDWSSPIPVCLIGDNRILLKMGRVHVSFDGDIILDRNNGSFKHLGYYHVDSNRLNDKGLISHLTQKAWFDDDIFEDFKRCYLLACGLAGKVPVPQLRMDY